MGFPGGSDVNARGVCNFLGSVSLRKKFEIIDRPVLQSHVNFLRQTSGYSSVLFRKWREIHPRGVRADRPERLEEKRNPWLNFGSSIYTFVSSPLSLPFVNWASQESCLFYLRFSLQSLDLPLFYFCRIFPPLSFSQHHSGLLFPILTT